MNTLTCRADINGDMRVNADDRTLLLNAWGQCLTCSNCPMDLNCDCTVNHTDLAIMLNTWSRDNFCDIEPICITGIEGFVQSDPLTEALTALGFTDADDFASWAQEASPQALHATWELLWTLFHS